MVGEVELNQRSKFFITTQQSPSLMSSDIFLYTFISGATRNLNCRGADANRLRRVVERRLRLQRQTRKKSAGVPRDINAFVVNRDPSLLLVNALHRNSNRLAFEGKVAVVPPASGPAAGLSPQRLLSSLASLRRHSGRAIY